MNSMFYKYNNLTSLDVTSFNISKVAHVERMFEECSKLTELDVSNMATSNTEMLFYGCCNFTILILVL